jgi:hypothetical protein
LTVLNLQPNKLTSDGEDVDMEFRFVQGGEYCCTELGCHFHAWNANDWQSLRQQLHKQGVSIGYPMTIRIRVIVEAGAISSSQAVAKQYSYERVFEEATSAHP